MTSELNRRNALQTIIDTINRKISEGVVLDDIIVAIFQDLSAIVQCDRLDIGIVEENGQIVTIRHAIANYEPLILGVGYSIIVPGSCYQRVFDTRKWSITDFQRDLLDYENHETLELLAAEGIRSYIILPVNAGKGIIGLFSCGMRGDVHYMERQGLILEEIVKTLVYPFERAYQAEQIEKNYRAYMEMLGFVSHELRSPISSIITLTQTLEQGYYGKIDDRQREILQRIVKKAEYVHAMSSQYLNLSRFESNLMEMRLQLVDFIDDIIDPVVDILLPQIEDRGVKLERKYEESVYPVRCDPDLVKIVIINLLSNGIKYCNKGGTLRITLLKGFKKFTISIWNEGPGFSEFDKTRLFKKFSRLQAQELIEQKGTGIGLYISWKIVQLHCGRIYAESEQGSWARFTVDLPQYQDLCIIE